MLPLAVDLDGTLIKTDLLIESFLGLMKRSPLNIFRVVFWLLRGKATLKAEIARRVDIDVDVLPYNEALVAYLREQKAQGRRCTLATASHRKYADQVAGHLDLFDDVVATDGDLNLASSAKADALTELYGEGQFVYAGNAPPDFAVWKASGGAIVCGDAGLARAAERHAPVELHLENRAPGLKDYVKACRLHQWLKNALIMVPLVAAHRVFELELLFNCILAFGAFSLCASSVYLMNDLLDLNADRHHRSKNQRPFASGAVPAVHGIFLIPVLLALVVAIATQLPLSFGIVLVVYYVATTAYSFSLKKRIMLDVIILAGLYTIRIIAGAAATGIPLSEWLLAFSMFIFLSLALVKRYTELVDLRARGEKLEARGRGYAVDDIELLASLGGASGYISVMVLALYINSELVNTMYTNPYVLWGICPLMLYWISRVWILAHRGQMHDDPIVFAIKDSVSRYTGVLIGVVVAFAVL